MSSAPVANVVTLGCSKNLVDSEQLMKMLADAGYTVRHEPARAARGSITIINTCGFIGDAKQESIDEILRWVERKKRGQIAALYVMGCLSERYRSDLEKEIPEVDRYYGKMDWPALVSDLVKSRPATAPYDRIITTPRHHAYIKIAEGCNRFCAFCAIPLITGRFHSRTIESITAEMTELAARGVKEFNIIAQDLTSYGTDLYGHNALAELIDAMATVPGAKRIRLHYAYPSDFPDEAIHAMARHANVCRYLDIALQHISDPVLKAMRRHITAEQTCALLDRLRAAIPGIHIRTTLMVGFPGETEQDFEQLLDFVRTQRFERMGAFAYCEEDDTWAARHLTDSVPPEVKQERLDRLMALQEEISLELQQEKVGSTMEVIIDREENDYYVGRTEFDSPEVDPEVLIEKNVKLRRGEIYPVIITEALPYELIAKPVK